MPSGQCWPTSGCALIRCASGRRADIKCCKQRRASLDRQVARFMLAVIIPTLNAERTLGRTLASILPGMVAGVVKQVLIADGGSTDRTIEIADSAGVDVINSERGRGHQLMAGAGSARQPWLLFLHADTVLEPEWDREVAGFIARAEGAQVPHSAAAFRFKLDDQGWRPRLWELAVAARCSVFKLPYGDQGLLMSRALYERLGGYRPLPLMEDVDLVRRLARRELSTLNSSAVTSAQRFREEGYARRSLRNLTCLALYFARVPMTRIEAFYRTRTR
jgi:rSAM/selenodomain-associated transferase 2